MRDEVSARSRIQLYPDYTAEIAEINRSGISVDLLYKIIHKHKPNSEYNRKLYERYRGIKEGVPIYGRKPRYEDSEDIINNRIANDFFGEIIDFKTGYFAGTPIAYNYAEAEDNMDAADVISEFVTRNNMFDVDMEVTKFASIYGYAGRLLYIDKAGEESVMPVHGYETIILSNTNMTAPEYAVRYYYTKTIDNNKIWHVEFYDSANVYYYIGQLSDLKPDDTRTRADGKPADPVEPHMFSYCPLQGVPNNEELIGDAEKVLSNIDDYDKAVSDNSNEIEAFVHALLVFENINVDDGEIRKAQHTGAICYRSGSNQGKAYFLTKDINDSFTEHHLERQKDNIYRFSKTPNLSDDTFGSASGISLKFKLHGLETKCGMFQAKMMSAGVYMFKTLASSWNNRGHNIDYLNCTMDFSRNFPLDIANEAQAAVQLKSVGLPMELILGQLSFVDDVQYVMDLIERDKNDIPSLNLYDTPDDSLSESNADESLSGDVPREDSSEG